MARKKGIEITKEQLNDTSNNFRLDQTRLEVKSLGSQPDKIILDTSKYRRIQDGESKLLFGLRSNNSRTWIEDEETGEYIEVEPKKKKDGLRLWN